MNEAFVCPTCGGPLNYISENTPAIKCPFCGNSVIISRNLKTRPLAPQPNQGSQSSPNWKIILPLILFPIILGIGVVVLMVIQSANNTKVSQPVSAKPKLPVMPNKPTPPVNSFATVALKFGSKGIGPGLFDDAREIGVDGSSGKIYVGDYSGGRVQVFDPSGQFITQWLVDTKKPLRGLAADRRGKVYIIQGGVIYRYDGATGKTSEHISDSDMFNDVIVTADGGVVGATNGFDDDIMRFDASGKKTLTIRKAISSQTDHAELDSHVAVDGLGNIYILGTFNNAVLKYNSSGKFITRFGKSGDQPGQFQAPLAIAVDGQGRVYVSDMRGVQVFDSDGRYLDKFPVDGPAFSMVFNDKNELFIIARESVQKFTISK